MNVETTLNALKVLSTMEKIQLLSAQIETELRPFSQPRPRRSLRGLWRGLGISETELAAARQEMWNNFPRKNI